MSYNSNMLNDDILLILIFRYEPMVIILPHQSNELQLKYCLWPKIKGSFIVIYSTHIFHLHTPSY